MTLFTYCIVSKKYTLIHVFLFSLKKHTLFLDFCCFWHPKHGPRGTCLPVKNDPFSVFLYSSMISTFEYKWPPPGISLSSKSNSESKRNKIFLIEKFLSVQVDRTVLIYIDRKCNRVVENIDSNSWTWKNFKNCIVGLHQLANRQEMLPHRNCRVPHESHRGKGELISGWLLSKFPGFIFKSKETC